MYPQPVRQLPGVVARDDGFTLLELLIALAIAGLVTAMLLGGLRFGLGAADRGGERADQSRELMIVQSFLREELSRAVPLPEPVEDDGSTRTRRRPTNREEILFDGTADTMSFIAPVPAHLGLGGLYRATLEMASQQSAGRLTITHRLFRPKVDGSTEVPEGKVVDLIDGVAGIEFAYQGSPGDDTGGGWRDRWQKRPVLPSLIRIRLRFRDGDPRHWPDLIVATRLEGVPGCRYDKGLKRCVPR